MTFEKFIRNFMTFFETKKQIQFCLDLPKTQRAGKDFRWEYKDH